MFRKKEPQGTGAAEGIAMSANQLALWYLVAAVSFILALKGLSSPHTARRGNLFGMIGMAIALLVTLALVYSHSKNVLPILGGMAVGGAHRRDRRAARADDADAGAGRGDALAGRPRRGADRHRGGQQPAGDGTRRARSPPATSSSFSSAPSSARSRFPDR